MSITRYTPQLGQAFKLPVQNVGAFVRIAAPWLALSLASVFVADTVSGGASFSFLIGAVALGGFGFHWQRFVGGDQATPVSLVSRLVRLTMWVVAYQSLLGFELVAQILMGSLLAGQANADMLIKAGAQIFQILIGGLFLMLPHLAMATRAEIVGTRLQEMVLAAGVAVGFGYVLGYLPFMVLSDMARDGFAQYAPGAGVAAVLTERVIHFASVVISAGFFALVWVELRATAPSPTSAGSVDEAKEPKDRRTTRITRASKARR